MAFIRQYKPEDFDAAAHICRETLAPSLVGSEPAERLAPYIWTHQFTHLSPSTCFILDDGTGRAVGYCIGCPDIATFTKNYPSYITSILEPSAEITKPVDVSTKKEPWNLEDGSINETCLTQTAWNPYWLLIHENEDVYEEGYRAIMHIDLLPEWQAKGWGRKLVKSFADAVAKEKKPDTKGIWLGIAPDNSKVIKFYEKVGFRLWEGGQGLRMVRDVEP